MLVEQFPGGRHNFPEITVQSPSRAEGEPTRFTTTVQSVVAHDGRFVYDDHTTPWSVVCATST